MPSEITKGFDSEGFYQALAATVRQREITWKEVSRETGVSATTLARMAKGRQPDGPGLAAIATWSGLDPRDYVASPRRARQPDVLAVISTALRKDTNLSPEAASAIDTMVQSAYGQLRKR